ncbi:MAG TPA: translation elongation factor Ts [Acidimicrobiales bacterium]|nr:translation elongation factor Ts [Acidimicrobiales bacterium]
MASFTAKEVAELRRRTGAGILDCREALQECDGDLAKAEQWLREQGKISVRKREDRERAEGAVAVVVEGLVGAIVALECETDFVAKSAEFVQLVDELAAELAAGGEPALEAQRERVEKLAVTLKENIAVGQTRRFEAPVGSVIGSYLHIQNGRGVNAVLVELAGGTPELAHDIAVHVAFTRPEYLRREDVPEDVVAAERQTVEAIARNEGKPDASLPKIIEGRLNGWFKERCLLEQPYVRDEKQSIADLLRAHGGAELRRFAQVVVGS